MSVERRVLLFLLVLVAVMMVNPVHVEATPSVSAVKYKFGIEIVSVSTEECKGTATAQVRITNYEDPPFMAFVVETHAFAVVGGQTTEGAAWQTVLPIGSQEHFFEIPIKTFGSGYVMAFSVVNYLSGEQRFYSKDFDASVPCENPLNSNCLIATATYGSQLAPEVQFLREFRDERIMRTFAGSSFMAVFNAWYYSFSPGVAEYERTHQNVRQSMRVILWPLMGVLHLSSMAYSAFEFEPELAALIGGLIASSLIGLVYLSLPVMGLLRLLRRRIDASVNRRIMKWLGILMFICLTGFTVSLLLLLPQMMMVFTLGIVLTGLSVGSILPALSIMKK